MSDSLSFDEYVFHVRNQKAPWTLVEVAKEFQNYPYSEIHQWVETHDQLGLWYTTGQAALFENPDDALVFKLKFG